MDSGLKGTTMSAVHPNIRECIERSIGNLSFCRLENVMQSSQAWHVSSTCLTVPQFAKTGESEMV